MSDRIYTFLWSCSTIILAIIFFGADYVLSWKERDTDHDGYRFEKDCDEHRKDVNVGQNEICDGVDNNCDGTIDENMPPRSDHYSDADSDGYGYGDPFKACFTPSGSVTKNGDCNDKNSDINPGMTDSACDGIDNDCDRKDGPDADRDGVRCDNDPDDLDARIAGVEGVGNDWRGVPLPIGLCSDGLDNDGDGLVDQKDEIDCFDRDKDGFFWDDACPDIPGSYDSFKYFTGCPKDMHYLDKAWKDPDRDDVPSRIDACPNVPYHDGADYNWPWTWPVYRKDVQQDRIGCPPLKKVTNGN